MTLDAYTIAEQAPGTTRIVMGAYLSRGTRAAVEATAVPDVRSPCRSVQHDTGCITQHVNAGLTSCLAFCPPRLLILTTRWRGSAEVTHPSPQLTFSSNRSVIPIPGALEYTWKTGKSDLCKSTVQPSDLVLRSQSISAPLVHTERGKRCEMSTFRACQPSPR